MNELWAVIESGAEGWAGLVNEMPMAEAESEGSGLFDKVLLTVVEPVGRTVLVASMAESEGMTGSTWLSALPEPGGNAVLENELFA